MIDKANINDEVLTVAATTALPPSPLPPAPHTHTQKVCFGFLYQKKGSVCRLTLFVFVIFYLLLQSLVIKLDFFAKNTSNAQSES